MKQFDSVCIIDDDKLFTYILSKQMRTVNFCKTITIFANGMEAIRHLEPIVKTPDVLPSVILLDLNMPILDGWQFLDEFAKMKFSKPITVYIVSSSINTADHRKAETYSTVSNFYIKPITKSNLMEMLESA